ncbi:MAG: hypothetical protein J5739_00395, partial [Lachnospiraceae bacterium]|nr:hypothetical protein [Lachnospiraceae bacterium]
MKKMMFRLLGSLMLAVVTVCNGCAHESEEDTSVTSSIDYDAMDALEGVRLSIEEGTLSSTGATFILYNGSDYDIRLYPEPEKTAFHVFKDSEWVNVKDETYNMTLRVLKISPSTEW